ncbi:C-X-C motif chemokine 9 [Tupaia chinensis]|uniref:C-X-C motif chemokine n=1 Tax=Tupaia chinensis TaxID=246437 RepID=L9L6I1_TUPCH|nr:C-X-C motif chemokine 9 [Tupaia chinensis]ELW70488.1 C-X-C motif chemokine 9 [Tupaia chinensis]
MEKKGILLFLNVTFLVLVGIQGALIMKSGRCVCIDSTKAMIHLRFLKDIKQYAPSPFCEKTEIIATMKNGDQACLNPDSANVKKLIKDWEKKVNQKKKQRKGKKRQKGKKFLKVKKSQRPHQKKTT